jgi:hypothetical protein
MDANHKVNSKGGIEFPVFHRNHRCIRGSSSFNKMNDEIPMDIIDDISINPSIFLMPINRGTPRVMNLVAFDKGSTLSWIQCQPCTVKCHNQSNKAGPIFDPRKSSSFRNVRCKSLECLHIHDTLQLPVNCMEKDICTSALHTEVDRCLALARWPGTAFVLGEMAATFSPSTSCLAAARIPTTITLKRVSSDSAAAFFPSLSKCRVGWAATRPSSGSVSSSSSSSCIYMCFIFYVLYINRERVGTSFRYCFPSDETQKGYMVLVDYDRSSEAASFTRLVPSKNRPTYSLYLERLIVGDGDSSLVTTSSEMIVRKRIVCNTRVCNVFTVLKIRFTF